MTDYIERQAAIEAVGYYSLHSGDKLLFADKPLKELPSAQIPEWVQTVERWYNKALCKPHIDNPMAWALYQAWMEYDCPNCVARMTDYIDKHEAIKALGNRPSVWSDGDLYALGSRNQYDLDRLAIETIPSADVEPAMRRKSVLTNADRIRAMSDKELAKWVARHDCRTNIYGYDTAEAILDWLMKEAQDG